MEERNADINLHDLLYNDIIYHCVFVSADDKRNIHNISDSFIEELRSFKLCPYPQELLDQVKEEMYKLNYIDMCHLFDNLFINKYIPVCRKLHNKTLVVIPKFNPLFQSKNSNDKQMNQILEKSPNVQYEFIKKINKDNDKKLLNLMISRASKNFVGLYNEDNSYIEFTKMDQFLFENDIYFELLNLETCDINYFKYVYDKNNNKVKEKLVLIEDSVLLEIFSNQ